jgi:hypothetical protein
MRRPCVTDRYRLIPSWAAACAGGDRPVSNGASDT